MSTTDPKAMQSLVEEKMDPPVKVENDEIGLHIPIIPVVPIVL